MNTFIWCIYRPFCAQPNRRYHIVICHKSNCFVELDAILAPIISMFLDRQSWVIVGCDPKCAIISRIFFEVTKLPIISESPCSVMVKVAGSPNSNKSNVTLPV